MSYSQEKYSESIFHVFASRYWSLWSISAFQLIGWNSSLLLKEIYVDGWFQRAEQNLGWLINTGCRSGRDRQAEQVNE